MGRLSSDNKRYIKANATQALAEARAIIGTTLELNEQIRLLETSAVYLGQVTKQQYIAFTPEEVKAFTNYTNKRNRILNRVAKAKALLEDAANELTYIAVRMPLQKDIKSLLDEE